MIQYSGADGGIGALPLQRGWHGWQSGRPVGMETGEGKRGQGDRPRGCRREPIGRGRRGSPSHCTG